jgi:hypothetical protein
LSDVDHIDQDSGLAGGYESGDDDAGARGEAGAAADESDGGVSSPDPDPEADRDVPNPHRAILARLTEAGAVCLSDCLFVSRGSLRVADRVSGS